MQRYSRYIPFNLATQSLFIPLPRDPCISDTDRSHNTNPSVPKESLKSQKNPKKNRGSQSDLPEQARRPSLRGLEETPFGKDGPPFWVWPKIKQLGLRGF